MPLTHCVGDDPTTPTNDTDGGGTKGLTCTTGDTCTSGKCIDGFCCDTACDAQCQACNVSGHEGTCTPVTGKPQHGACSGDQDGTCAGSCDGTKVDACTYPTTTCGGSASCAGGVAQVPAACSNGTCGTPSTQTCTAGCFQDSCLAVVQLAASRESTCVVLTDSNVRCWGSNTNGQIAQGNVLTANYPNPTEVFYLDGKGTKMVGALSGSMCAVLGDGTVDCWGNNFSGQLGSPGQFGTSTPVPTPTAVVGVSGATFISSSTSGRFCAIVTGGAVKCWGDNIEGSLGSGADQATLASTNVARDLCAPGETALPCAHATNATFIVGGDRNMCGIFSGKLACWGSNSAGQLGTTPDSNDHPFPAFVPGSGDVTSVAQGNSVTCFTTTDGKVFCLGQNSGGTLGIGNNNTPISTPTEVCSSQDCSQHLPSVSSVATYDDVSCALASESVHCWGSNSVGQLGDGTTSGGTNFAASAAIASGAIQIATGGETSFAIISDGADRIVKCWGDNASHQCGDGADAGLSHNTPVSPKW